MWPFRGTISGTVDSVAQDLPMLIESFSLVNKTAGAIGVNVYMVSAAHVLSIIPLNKQLAAGEIYESERPIVMLATDKIRVSTSGSTDYYFTISNDSVP